MFWIWYGELMYGSPNDCSDYTWDFYYKIKGSGPHDVVRRWNMMTLRELFDFTD